jgi:hypothetical protein
MRRRAAIEPVIGHLKGDHRMRRNHLKGRDGDRVDAVLPPSDSTSAWSSPVRAALTRLLLILQRALSSPASPKLGTRETFFTDDYVCCDSSRRLFRLGHGLVHRLIRAQKKPESCQVAILRIGKTVASPGSRLFEVSVNQDNSRSAPM